jgi:hypothetical protein
MYNSDRESKIGKNKGKENVEDLQIELRQRQQKVLCGLCA